MSFENKSRKQTIKASKLILTALVTESMSLTYRSSSCRTPTNMLYRLN